MCDHIFKGKEQITFQDFLDLKREFRVSLLHFFFNKYETDENNTISAEDFAKTLLNCFNFKKSQGYLRRIHQIKLEGRVGFNEFLAFHDFLTESDDIIEKVNAYKYLDKKLFKEIVEEFVQHSEFC